MGYFIQTRKGILVLILFIFALILLMLSVEIGLGYEKQEVRFDTELRGKERGMLSFTFDDGYKEHYEKIFPMMEKYGFVGSEFLVASWKDSFEEKKLMTFQDAKNMQDAGWEIGSHSFAHRSLNMLNEGELFSELQDSKKILEENGLITNTIAYPFGRINPEVLSEARKYYSAGRGLENGYNDINNYDLFDIKVKMITRDVGSEDVCSWIRYAHDDDLWLVLVFHHISEKEESSWDESFEDFERIAECAFKSGIGVRTIKDIVNVRN